MLINYFRTYVGSLYRGRIVKYCIAYILIIFFLKPSDDGIEKNSKECEKVRGPSHRICLNFSSSSYNMAEVKFLLFSVDKYFPKVFIHLRTCSRINVHRLRDSIWVQKFATRYVYTPSWNQISSSAIRDNKCNFLQP